MLLDFAVQYREGTMHFQNVRTASLPASQPLILPSDSSTRTCTISPRTSGRLLVRAAVEFRQIKRGAASWCDFVFVFSSRPSTDASWGSDGRARYGGGSKTKTSKGKAKATASTSKAAKTKTVSSSKAKVSKKPSKAKASTKASTSKQTVEAASDEEDFQDGPTMTRTTWYPRYRLSEKVSGDCGPSCSFGTRFIPSCRMWLMLTFLIEDRAITKGQLAVIARLKLKDGQKMYEFDIARLFACSSQTRIDFFHEAEPDMTRMQGFITLSLSSQQIVADAASERRRSETAAKKLVQSHQPASKKARLDTGNGSYPERGQRTIISYNDGNVLARRS